MTRRIILTLADDTTATECGACPARLPFECALFGDYAGPTMMTRAPECIAAEAAAKQDDDDRAEGAKMRQIRELLRADAYDKGEPLTFERLERAAGKAAR